VFVQQEILQAANVAVRKYHETTAANDKITEGVAHAMRAGAKEKNAKLYVKMIKLLVVANPSNRLAFLQEVSSTAMFSL